ncbi:MAG: FAD-binding oxidoreductase [Planctomycetia bacterium]|nr:FAD-binding oxidoreductase [Planctomycetia bacterium]
MLSHTDFIILGQGLAGTALAWRLRQRGRSVLVVDRESSSSSRIAAGLITPITGKRLAKSWRWDELYPAASVFYRELETKLGASFFHTKEALRLFRDEAEHDEFHRRAGNILAGLVLPEVYYRRDWFHAPFGGFEMSAVRLDVTRYLDLSREHFQTSSAYLRAEIDPVHDVELIAKGVRLAKLGVEARNLIFCRGFTSVSDPWFGRIQFNAAKGEILTLRIPTLEENRVVHCGVWLAPMSEDIFLAGSTYSWDQLDSLPTAEGRAEIETRLRAFLKLPYEVIDHRAAVRPVIDAGFPVLGRHPEFPQLAYFNGLGSKGSLLTPFFANQLAANLCGAGEIDAEVNVRKFFL